MQKIAVIDYGMGNLRSVSKALEHVANGDKIIITADKAEIQSADRIVFPGQGAMGSAMSHLAERGLIEILRHEMKSKPFLGLCLGLQVLMGHSDEDGGHDGMNAVPGNVRHFDHLLNDRDDRLTYKIPHMGWNNVSQILPHPLWQGIDDGERFYFVHSYCVQAACREQVYGETNYGVAFTAAAGSKNVFAVQFHPEKSQQPGLQLLRNFVLWDGNAQ